MDFLEFDLLFKELLLDVDMAYFYHVTSKGVSEHILEEGLLLAENRLSSTTVPITNDYKNEPLNYLLEDIGGTSLRPQEEIVIIGCPKEIVNDLIQENYNVDSNWIQDFPSPYVISNEFILGYLNLEEEMFILNETYLYNGEEFIR